MNYETKAPTTPAIRQLGTDPLALAPINEEATSSCTAAPVCTCSAAARVPDSGTPAT